MAIKMPPARKINGVSETPSGRVPMYRQNFSDLLSGPGGAATWVILTSFHPCGEGQISISQWVG